jgi:hypothetical protein
MRTPLIRWAWLPVIALLAPLAIALRLDSGSAPAGAEQENAMAIDADASDPDIDESSVRYTGEPWFEISTNIAAAPTPYGGYTMSVEFDDSILSFVPVGDYGIVYTGLGGMEINVPSTLQDVDADTDPEFIGSTGRTMGTTAATGQANLARFQCIALGSSVLHLLTRDQDPDFGSTTIAPPNGENITTSLADATINCSDATPVPTLTPTATPTSAAVGGIAELPLLAGASSEEAGAAAQQSGWSVGGYAALAGGLAAAAIVAVGAWHARRRWLG